MAMEDVNDLIARMQLRFKVDYPEIDCEICGTTIQQTPSINGKFYLKTVCKCEQDVIAERTARFQQATIDSQERSMYSSEDTGDRYKDVKLIDYIEYPGNEKCLKYARGYVKQFATIQKDDKRKGMSFAFFGEPGNGKTMLASCIRNELKEQGYKVFMISMIDLVDRIKATFDKNNNETQDSILKAIKICDLFIIDDFAAEKATEWVQERLLAIVDSRYKAKKPILLTTNVTPSEWPNKVGIRTSDRLDEIVFPVLNAAKGKRKNNKEELASDFFNILEDDMNF